MQILVAILLVLEGLSTGVTTVTRLPSMTVYPALTIAVIVVRGLVGVAEFAGGWMLMRNQPPGRQMARVILLASACLFTLELGFDLAPSNLFHTYHWPAVGAYWIYVAVAIALLRERGAKPKPEVWSPEP